MSWGKYIPEDIYQMIASYCFVQCRYCLNNETAYSFVWATDISKSLQSKSLIEINELFEFFLKKKKFQICYQCYIYYILEECVRSREPRCILFTTTNKNKFRKKEDIYYILKDIFGRNEHFCELIWVNQEKSFILKIYCNLFLRNIPKFRVTTIENFTNDFPII